MASLDIGIDLGTCTVIATDSTQSVVVREPSVVAVDSRTDKVIEIGSRVYDMIGRTPNYIHVIRPLNEGVISNFAMTEVLIRHMLKKITGAQMLKPRVTLCVPSDTTNVESQSVINAAVSAGARKVYLIEEPVAAAIGAGLDLSKPEGHLIVDIGGTPATSPSFPSTASSPKAPSKRQVDCLTRPSSALCGTNTTC